MTLGYALAKELKDSGFPQTVKGVTMIPPTMPHGTTAVAPTLSELIEACKEHFFELIKAPDHGQWSGLGWKDVKNDTGDKHVVHGTTPEEAVARLWLALNKEA
jgi:hypothetical protein